jgi:hypothetical protein
MLSFCADVCIGAVCPYMSRKEVSNGSGLFGGESDRSVFKKDHL